MPKRGYKQTPEHRSKIGFTRKGKPFTGKATFSWRGKKFSEEHRRRLSISHGGKHFGDEKYKRWMKNKRNRMKRSNGGFHTFGEWDTLKAQYNWTCPSCRKPEPLIQLTEDHIIPISKGGTDNIENIQPLCKICNCKKRDIHTTKYDNRINL
jgi:5-methylcytosine-specific restriction endonuclease McrA